MLRWWRRSSTSRRDRETELLGEQVALSRGILGEIQKSNRTTREWITFGVTTVIGLLTLAAMIAGVTATLSVRQEVDDLTTRDPQAVIDRLALGQTEAEIRSILNADPIASGQWQNPPFTDISSLRRVLFQVHDLGLTVEVLLDPLLQARVIEVTVLDKTLKVRFPRETGGTLSGAGSDNRLGPVDESMRFHTNSTTLVELLTACPSHLAAGGVGASWSYFALGCGAAGYNNFTPDIVAVNIIGGTARGLDAFVREYREQPLSSQSVSAAFGELTFNSFALVDRSMFRDGGFGEGDFETLLDTYELGPSRGEIDL